MSSGGVAAAQWLEFACTTSGIIAMKMPSFVLAVAVATTATAYAHHSGSMFDRSKMVTLEGTVKEYQFQNPHVWIEILVPGTAGEPVQWSIEGETRATMSRIGLPNSALKPGDKVTIHAHPLRDGRNGGVFIDLTLPSGAVIDTH
jgi:Family of unknown function (DUF6152)